MNTLKHVLIACSLILWTSLAHAGTLSIISDTRWVKVAAVIDGDTFHTNHREKIRLLGINTPEIMHDDKPGQPLGQTARKRLQELILGKTVQLEFDHDKRDDYGRLRGQWMNGILVEEGLAHVYTFAPNFKWAASTTYQRKDSQAKEKRYLGYKTLFRTAGFASETLIHRTIPSYTRIR